jgi:hypothetical protein
MHSQRAKARIPDDLGSWAGAGTCRSVASASAAQIWGSSPAEALQAPRGGKTPFRPLPRPKLSWEERIRTRRGGRTKPANSTLAPVPNVALIVGKKRTQCPAIIVLCQSKASVLSAISCARASCYVHLQVGRDVLEVLARLSFPDAPSSHTRLRLA